MSQSDHRLSGKAALIGGCLNVYTIHGPVRAQDGDWIVYWSSSEHELEVFTPDDFKRKFDRSVLQDGRDAIPGTAGLAFRNIHFFRQGARE